MRSVPIRRISTSAGMLVLAGTMFGCGGGTDSKLALASRTLAAVSVSAPESGQDSAQASGEREDASAGALHRGGDVYGVINLAPSGSRVAAVNARGQAAFEYDGLDGRLHVGFFNGRRVIDLTPPNSTVSTLGGLNDKGEVAFRARFAQTGGTPESGFRPLRWSAASGLASLPSFNPDADAYIAAINNRSEMVGLSQLDETNASIRGARWTAANRLLPLPGPAGVNEVLATDINDNNVSVGFALTPDGTAHALRWDAAARLTVLGTFGADSAVADIINDRGDIAGRLDTRTGTVQSFLWSPGKGVVRPGADTIPLALNRAGEMVGAVYRPYIENRAFLFSRARGLVDLHPRSSEASEANDINDSGVAVGMARHPGAKSHAYRWSRTGAAVDLNTRLLNPPAGLVLTNALAISANGDIVADSNAGVVFLRRGGGGTDAPVLGPVQLPQPRLDQPARLSLSFRDRNLRDTHTATVDWGDGKGPQPAVVVRGNNGNGEVRSEHTFTANGDYDVIVRVTDSTGRTTTTYEEVFILEHGGPDLPVLLGKGVLQDGGPPRAMGAAAGGQAAPLMFRLAAPLAANGSAGTPFIFTLHGSTSFQAQRLEQATREGSTVRLEGVGRMNGRSGYRFVVHATVGGGPAGSDRMSVRISETGGAQRLAFEAGLGAGAKRDEKRDEKRDAQAGVPSGVLLRGTLRLVE